LSSQPRRKSQPRIKEKPQSVGPSAQRSEEQNPFRDTEGIDGSEAQREVAVARDALDRLQQLTSKLEAELRQLGSPARSGQLSSEDRA
jgi:hypothetical protein